MSKLKRIPDDKLHDIAILVIQKKVYSETDVVELANQISDDYLTAYKALQERPSRNYKGVSS